MSLEVMKQALEALEEAHLKPEHKQDEHKREQAITALRAALAEEFMQRLTEAQQEIEQWPVAYVTGYYDGHLVVSPIDHVVIPTGMALYTHPPRREWVELTDKEITRIGNLDWDSNYVGIWYDFARAIEAKLKEKNYGGNTSD